MIFLSNSFSDNYYKESLNTNPLPSVCIAGEKAPFLKQCLLQAEALDFQIHLTLSDSLDGIKTKKKKLSVGSNNGLLKSKWCYKHQYQDFGCILLSFELNEHHGEAVLDRLNNILKQVNDKLIRSNVVIVGITQETRNSVAKEFVSNLHQLSKKSLGERLYGFTTVCVNSANHLVASDLRKVVVNAVLGYHKSEVLRLKEKKKLLSAEQHFASAIARTYFQIAWHHLIIHEYQGAKKNLLKAYKILRVLFPNFPPFDARMVASLFLLHVISVLPLCGDILSEKTEVYEVLSSHINWIGHAFTSHYDRNCKNFALALKSALVAEWCEILARKTIDINPLIRSDLLISAANNLLQIKSLSQTSPEQKTSISSPPYIGTECLNGLYADAFFGMFRQSVLAVHICGLLKEASATSSPEYRKSEKHYLELCAHDTLNLDLLERLLEKDWHSLFASDFFSALFLDRYEGHHFETTKDELLYYILVSGCVSPLFPSARVKFQNRLEELSERPPPTLSYPHGSFQPPFTVVTQIEQNFMKVSDGSASLIFIFFTTSVMPITLTNIQISLLDINFLNAEEGVLEITVPGSYEIEACRPKRAKVEITFPQNGKYICNKLRATVSMTPVMFDVVWSLYQFSKEVGTKRSPFLAKLPIVNVARPFSFANVSSAACVEAVEHEDFEVPISIEGRENLLTNVSISFSYLPEFFSGALYYTSPENGAIKPCENILRTNDELAYILTDIFPSHRISLLLRGKCLRSGVYQVPIIFRHSTKDFVDMEIVRISVLVINPPFSVDYSCFASTLWCSTAGEVNFPTINSAYQQRDLNILEKPKDNKLLQMSTSTAEWYHKKTALYYAVRDEAVSSKTPLRTSVGEMLTFHINLVCTAGKKIRVLKSDVVCSEELQLHSLSFGELPCALDDEESMSLVAQLRAQKKGVLSPGFVRILFTPQSSPSSHLVADLSLPLIIIEDSAIKIKYVYPSTVLFGDTIILKLNVLNTGRDLFRGELLVDTRSDCFGISGRTHWDLVICPRDNTEEQIKLIPLKVGELPLPLIQLNDIHGSVVVAQPTIPHHVTIISGRQPCSAFDTLAQVI